MYDALLFLNDGFEEIEALTPLDVLRRGGCRVASVSLTGKKEVTGAHDIIVKADFLYDEWLPAQTDTREMMMILPGGPGTSDYKKHEAFLETLRRHRSAGGCFAAICAAPSILGLLGFLPGITAVCFPGYEPELTGAVIGTHGVEEDGVFITAKSAGFSMPFALAVLGRIKGAEVSDKIRDSVMGEA